MSQHKMLFVLDTDGKLILNREEAKKIPEFKKIIERDKGSKGDYDGRLKYRAVAEIYYIYLVYDVRSLYYNLPLKDKQIQAKRDAELPNKWKEDVDIEEAIKAWQKAFELSADGKAYAVAEKAYFTSASDTEEMQDLLVEHKVLLKDIIKRAKDLSKKDGSDLTLLTNIKEATALIEAMVSTQKKIFDNIKGFKDLSKTVRDLATKFAEEGGSLKLVVGGRELGNREE